MGNAQNIVAICDYVKSSKTHMVPFFHLLLFFLTIFFSFKNLLMELMLQRDVLKRSISITEEQLLVAYMNSLHQVLLSMNSCSRYNAYSIWVKT